MSVKAETEGRACRVYLVRRGSAAVAGIAKRLAAAGFEVLGPDPETAESGDYEVALLPLDRRNPEPSELSALVGVRGRSSPPVVVFGPPRGRKWRRTAMEAGAFLCLSGDAPSEDQIGVLAAAGRYRALQSELNLIRSETEVVVQGLLESFGAEAEKLQSVVQDAAGVRESLEEVQRRIIRSML